MSTKSSLEPNVMCAAKAVSSENYMEKLFGNYFVGKCHFSQFFNCNNFRLECNSQKEVAH